MTVSNRWRWAIVIGVLFAAIVVPFLLFGPQLETWAVAGVDRAAAHPWAVAIVIAALLASDVVLPIPSSLVSTAAGALLGPALGTAASFVGMTAGCVVGYVLGRTLGRGSVAALVGEKDLRRLSQLAARHGPWALVAARPLPVLAEASVVLAGVGAMPPRRFATQIALANLGISGVYAIAGASAVAVQSFLLAVAAAVLVPLLPAAALRLLRR